MAETRWFSTLLCCLWMLSGCASGAVDDDASDDDDEVMDDDVADDDTGDDDTAAVCSPCDGSYTVDSEEDFDAVVRCSSITDDLEIRSQDLLTSFSLPCLETVDGFLSIFDNDSLPDLDGLTTITIVGGHLEIMGNACLPQADAEAFAAAIDVDGVVNVSNNEGPCP